MEFKPTVQIGQITMTRRRKRILITVLIMAVLFWTQFAIPWLGSRIRVSPETTHITEPMDAEGYVDYVAAMNRMTSRGTTPKNNAAVLVSQAFGPGASEAGLRGGDFFAKLGIPKPPSDGDYFVATDKFIARRESAEEDTNTVAERTRWRELHAATLRPWRADEHPWLAEWLKENDGPLDLVVKASRRSRWFAPLREDLTLLGQTTLASDLKKPARALRARAMLKLANRDLRGACDDAIACRRLGRLVRQEPLVISMLIGVALETQGIEATAALVHFGRPPAKIVNKLRKPLAGLPPPRSLVELLDIGQRFTQLDALMAWARGEIGQAKDPVKKWSLRSYDWNIMLRQGNMAMDRLVNAAKTEDPASRIQALRQSHQKIDNRIEQRTNGWLAVLSMLYRSGRSRYIGDMLASIQLTEAHIYARSLHRTDVLSKLSEMASVFGTYRVDHGEYPETLESLVPEYLDALPKDPRGRNVYRYRRTKDGCLIYSVGLNGRDDEGRNQALERDDTVPKDADDIFLRFPPRVPE